MMTLHSSIAISVLLLRSYMVYCQFSGGSNSSTTAAGPVSCPRPPVIPNTDQTITGLCEGSELIYSCLPGYEGAGSMHRTCTNGVWIHSGVEITCTAIRCPRPTSITGGSFTSPSSGYIHGSVVRYRCRYGYVINSTTTDITCQANKTWTLPLPVCSRRDCGPPPDVSGANISFTSTFYQSSATYTCLRGYSMYSVYRSYSSYRRLRSSGTTSISCQGTGNWRSAPTCTRRSCGWPPYVTNGRKFTTGNNKFEDTVTYECKHGYEIKGNYTIICRDTGSWSQRPTCSRIACDNPPQINHGTNDLAVKAFYGNSTAYSCDKGYEMIGGSVIFCQADGMWTQQPSCVIVDCRTPPAIHFGIHKWNSTTYNSRADYSCEAGYKLIGVPSIHCLASGRWMEGPTCELPPGQEAPIVASPTKQVKSAEQSGSSSSTGLAVVGSLLGVVLLLGVAFFVHRNFIANKNSSSPLSFSNNLYKSGEDGLRPTTERATTEASSA